jgi:hypothetical protein
MENGPSDSKKYTQSACIVYVSLLIVSFALTKCSLMFSHEIGFAAWAILITLSGPANLLVYGRPSIMVAALFMLAAAPLLPLIQTNTRFRVWLAGILIYWLWFGGLMLYALLNS